MCFGHGFDIGDGVNGGGSARIVSRVIGVARQGCHKAACVVIADCIGARIGEGGVPFEIFCDPCGGFVDRSPILLRGRVVRRVQSAGAVPIHNDCTVAERKPEGGGGKGGVRHGVIVVGVSRRDRDRKGVVVKQLDALKINGVSRALVSRKRLKTDQIHARAPVAARRHRDGCGVGEKRGNIILGFDCRAVAEFKPFAERDRVGQGAIGIVHSVRLGGECREIPNIGALAVGHHSAVPGGQIFDVKVGGAGGGFSPIGVTKGA